MNKTTAKDMYYDRSMNIDLEKSILENYKWLIEEVIKRPELDFQTGSNNNDSWFSIYRGTGRILTINASGKLYAAPKYMGLNSDFYKNPDRERLNSLLSKINNEKSLGRYYIDSKGRRKEGYYQNLISRRYSLFCEENDNFVIIDKEFVLGYCDNTVKEEITNPVQIKYDGIIHSLSAKYDYCKNIKQPGTECDFVGLTRSGDILLLELKRHEDTTKIYLSPIQAGKYDDLTAEYMKRFYDDFSHNVLDMVAQKIRMGILKPKWDMPSKLSGKIIPAVVVGGNPSQEAKNRFTIVREAVKKDITLYTCDEKGELIKIL